MIVIKKYLETPLNSTSICCQFPNRCTVFHQDAGIVIHYDVRKTVMDKLRILSSGTGKTMRWILLPKASYLGRTAASALMPETKRFVVSAAPPELAPAALVVILPFARHGHGPLSRFPTLLGAADRQIGRDLPKGAMPVRLPWRRRTNIC
ncbi:MAG: hypothetical protein IPJ30_26440 [Acidobacteria bacterium]|nr:hypothetical protein [Acidobacteriota bacterium]